MKLDLHIHTTYSDGVFSPKQIVDTALAQELNVIALTDHDNILSHKIATDYVKEIGANLEIIQGVEINTIYKWIFTKLSEFSQYPYSETENDQ